MCPELSKKTPCTRCSLLYQLTKEATKYTKYTNFCAEPSEKIVKDALCQTNSVKKVMIIDLLIKKPTTIERVFRKTYELPLETRQKQDFTVDHELITELTTIKKKTLNKLLNFNNKLIFWKHHSQHIRGRDVFVLA